MHGSWTPAGLLVIAFGVLLPIISSFATAFRLAQKTKFKMLNSSHTTGHFSVIHSASVDQFKVGTVNGNQAAEPLFTSQWEKKSSSGSWQGVNVEGFHDELHYQSSTLGASLYKTSHSFLLSSIDAATISFDQTKPEVHIDFTPGINEEEREQLEIRPTSKCCALTEANQLVAYIIFSRLQFNPMDYLVSKTDFLNFYTIPDESTRQHGWKQLKSTLDLHKNARGFDLYDSNGRKFQFDWQFANTPDHQFQSDWQFANTPVRPWTVIVVYDSSYCTTVPSADVQKVIHRPQVWPIPSDENVLDRSQAWPSFPDETVIHHSQVRPMRPDERPLAMVLGRRPPGFARNVRFPTVTRPVFNASSMPHTANWTPYIPHNRNSMH